MLDGVEKKTGSRRHFRAVVGVVGGGGGGVGV